MKAKLSAVLIIFCFAFASGPPANAHHSFCAEMDVTRPVSFLGTITKIEWNNPHVWLYLRVKDEKGAVKEWVFHAGPPHLLAQGGWNRDMLKAGDEVSIGGFLAKSGTPKGALSELKFKGTLFKVNATIC